jgi:hypothetical protein
VPDASSPQLQRERRDAHDAAVKARGGERCECMDCRRDRASGGSSRLTADMRQALRMLLGTPERYLPGVVSNEATARYDGQPWINYRTCHALRNRGLVVMEGVGEDATVRLTDAGREVAQDGR